MTEGFDYATARASYIAKAEMLHQNRSMLRTAEAELAKRDALLEMSHEVQKGSNEKARKALFVAAREVDKDIQAQLRIIDGLRSVIAVDEVMERVYRKDMDYCIALATQVEIS